MTPARRMHEEEGFAAIAALVVLVLLAALGSFLLTISNTAPRFARLLGRPGWA